MVTLRRPERRRRHLFGDPWIRVLLATVLVTGGFALAVIGWAVFYVLQGVGVL